MDNANMFRPLIQQIPGQPDPTSGDYADLVAGRGLPLAPVLHPGEHPACGPRVEPCRSALPDPNVTGPCQLQSSPFCTNEGRQRLDPLDMLKPETSFAAYTSACQACYDANADQYVAQVHRAPIAVGDIVCIGSSRMKWKVIQLDDQRGALVDLLKGSLLGPQWEHVCRLERVA